MTDEQKTILQITKKIEELAKDANEIRSRIFEESRKLFTKGVKKLFSDYTELNSFSWVQYTPYFNDGDECIFSVYIESLGINGNEDISLYYLEGLLSDLEQKDISIERYTKKLSLCDDYTREFYENTIKLLETTDIDELRKQVKMITDIRNFLDTIEPDFFQGMFGDHVRVIVSRSDIKTEKFEHE